MPCRPTICDIVWLAAIAVSGACAVSLGDSEGSSEPDITMTAAAETQSRPHMITGVGSCAASGCHGRPFDGKQRDWQTAYSIWLQEDPHRRAFDVLYAERSVEMYRNLHPEVKMTAEPPQDEAYFDFLDARCIGCHASGLPDGPAVAGTGEAGTRRPEDYRAGVGCESCHGPASGWLDGHYLRNWPKAGDPPRDSLAETGFRDTANLRTRAGVCVGCHVGPQAGSGRMYDVNHDLIAAGHPRLAFEFGAYLENYPKHWDDERDPARQRIVLKGSLPIDAWRFGQEQTALQIVRQIGLRLAASETAQSSPWPDFSSYECRDCHHSLRATSGHAGDRTGLPRPALAALDNLLALHGAAAEPIAAEESQWAAIDKLRAQLATPGQGQLHAADVAAAERELRARPLPRFPANHLGGHAEFLMTLLDQHDPALSASGAARHARRSLGWDEAVQFYLAVQALARGLPADSQQRSDLEEANELLRAALASVENFGPRDVASGITQYDFPMDFDGSTIADELAGVRQALRTILTKFPPPNMP